jgi:hypothetical protein
MKADILLDDEGNLKISFQRKCSGCGEYREVQILLPKKMIVEVMEDNKKDERLADWKELSQCEKCSSSASCSL